MRFFGDLLLLLYILMRSVVQNDHDKEEEVAWG